MGNTVQCAHCPGQCENVNCDGGALGEGKDFVFNSDDAIVGVGGPLFAASKCVNLQLQMAAFDGDANGIRRALCAGADVNTTRSVSVLSEVPARTIGRDVPDMGLKKQQQPIDRVSKMMPRVGPSKRVKRPTPLLHAAAQGHATAVDVLLKARADPHVVDDIGSTPLHLAADSGSLETVKVLLEAGAKSEALDDELLTPADRLPQYCTGDPQERAIWRDLLIHASV
eukprot:TRINITY_DN80798_c0_g1_i1.p1 TRINITY_DN80798_c0_g1~~TRINITY_DN80798_c0_g1_i1.p1  ORF type:complete len:226 (-),score=44.91 TRINITY_DN80798_c0_g1_i1:118-795(-)